jgi:hypothetical protein
MGVEPPAKVSATGFRGGAGASPQTAPLVTLEVVAAVIVGLGAIVYPIGFIQLVARVGFGSTNDFSTAWLVASLIPPVQVAGQGVKALVGGWPGLVIVPLAWIMTSRQRQAQSFKQAVLTEIGPWILIIGGVFGAAGVIGLALIEHSWRHASDVAVGGVEIFLLFFLFLSRQSRGAFAQWTIVLAIGYVSLVLISIIVAYYEHDPLLPHVAVGPYSGTLVAHSDRYWYVLTASGQLVAIPDSADTVVVGP